MEHIIREHLGRVGLEAVREELGDNDIPTSVD